MQTIEGIIQLAYKCSLPQYVCAMCYHIIIFLEPVASIPFLYWLPLAASSANNFICKYNSLTAVSYFDKQYSCSNFSHLKCYKFCISVTIFRSVKLKTCNQSVTQTENKNETADKQLLGHFQLSSLSPLQTISHPKRSLYSDSCLTNDHNNMYRVRINEFSLT